MRRSAVWINLAVVAAAAVGAVSASGMANPVSSQARQMLTAITGDGSQTNAAISPAVLRASSAVVQAAAAAPIKTVVSLTFDDGLASQVDAASALATHGVNGTFYVNSSTIGTSGFLTLAQLTSIAAAGNEIGGHSTYHYDIPNQDTLDEQRREVCGDRNWLLAHGFSPVSYAYPYSHWSSDLEAIVSQCGYTSARQGWMFDSTTCQSGGTACAETIPPADPYAIRTPEQVMSTMTLADLEQEVTAAEQTGGGWVPLELHNVCSNCGDYGVTVSVFNQFLDWLVARASQGTVVETVAQVMGNPPVAGPGPYPTPPTPDPSNMLQNPGLETVGPGWILPFQVPVRCWQEWGDWSQAATWTRTSDAHSGSYAMNIQLAGDDSYGYHAMVPTLDLGACAPTVSPGQVLTFSGWYKSNTPVDVFQLYRGTEKRWSVLAGAVTLSPAASWTKFTVTLPAMPSDATGVAPGFKFTHGGSFTVDDLSLTAGGSPPPPTPTLTVTDGGSGTGTVTSNPAGITCGATCSAQFAQGSTVTLTAAPATGSTFTGWSGACTGTGTCTVTMNAATAVTATFGVAAPAAPSGLSAVAASSSAMTLAWTDNASNETGYTVDRATSSAFTTVTSFTLPAGSTSYSDTGLTASTTYYYRVKATNATGSSAYSNTASATTQAAVPAAPSGLSAVAASSSSMTLAWTDNASNETGYTVDRATSSAFTTVTSFTLAAGSTSYSDTGLAASTTYYYRVKATNAAGSSAYSNTASATTQAAATVPAAPSGLSAVAASSSAMTLAWTDNASNETGYTVERATSSAFTTVTSFTLPANSVSYSDTGLAASTTYYYRVKATNATGSSAYSNTASATTQAAATVPAAPSGLSAVATSSTTMTLAWTDNASNETSFTLQRSTRSTFSTVTSFTLPANTTTYSDTGLAASTTYYYRVRATNAIGSSAYSSTASAKTPAAAVPAAPSALSAVAASPSSMTLAWTDNSTNETGFTVDRSTSSAFTTVTSFTLPAGSASYGDSGLTASTTYYYRVKATNATGSSPYSNTASATTQAAAAVPAAPSGLTAVAASSSAMTLAWTDNASNETGFTVDRSTSSAFTTVTSFTLPAGSASYSDTGLTASTTYYYRVKATNAAGSSAYSNTASATTQAATAPGYATAVLVDNPIAYWRLGETSGITAADQKSANPGTYYNGVTLGAASLLGQDTGNGACIFDGTNDFVNVYNSTALSPTAALTLEAWIKPTTLPATGTTRTIVAKLGSYSLQLNGALLQFAVVQGGTQHTVSAASGAIAAGGTYHVVATYDGTTERLYVNGVQVSSAALTGAITASSNSLTIGSGGAASYFQGTIDDVAVYGTALSATRVSAHYTAGA